ncbi:MAG: glycoside hydrolase family 1 protein [Deltaproteobacteria bacterium]|nr:glycoside hydrolase family 1 protein [Deltaproteobacteria bacterium]
MKTAIALLAAYAIGLAGCTDADPSPGPTPEPTEVTFPQGMLWGSATAGMQIEKGLVDTDWQVFSKEPGNVQGGGLPDAGPDALAHVDADVAAMKDAAFNAYRFSIELARIYPTRQSFDDDTPSEDGLAAYDGVLAALKQAGIVPMVTLHHFSWPTYLSDPAARKEPQGWERKEIQPIFKEWCKRAATRWGSEVDLWVTINEPNVEANVGYLAGMFPPGVSDVERTAAVMRAQVRAHASCYDAIHDADKVDADDDGASAAVGIAHHQRVYEPADPSSEDDLAAVERSRYVWNQWVMDAIVLGKVDDDFDGVAESEDPTLAKRADFYGLNYYGASRVDSRGLKFKYIGVVPAQYDVPNGRPKTDLGWDIYPHGFGVVLDEAAAYGRPIYITENGLADEKDVNRERFVAEHLFELGKARARGADVRGYLHWSLIDNFEWAAGYCPRFGLLRVDYDDPARKRTPTKALGLLRELALSNRLERTRIDALAAYQDKPFACAGF